jgi:hypothetical protein
MPKFYSFNRITRAFSGEGDAQPSPAEVGVFLLPANATFKVPPAFNPVNQTAVFDDVNWAVIQKPVEVIEQVVFGWTATDAEKHEVLMLMANDFMNHAAKAFGFTSIADAVASAPTGPATNQPERDALALKNWRMMVLAKFQEWIALVQHNHNPMPAVRAIMESLPKFIRIFPEPDMTPIGPAPLTQEQVNNPTSLNTVLGYPPGPAAEVLPPPFPHIPANAFPDNPNPTVPPPLPPMDPNLP